MTPPPQPIQPRAAGLLILVPLALVLSPLRTSSAFVPRHHKPSRSSQSIPLSVLTRPIEEVFEVHRLEPLRPRKRRPQRKSPPKAAFLGASRAAGLTQPPPVVEEDAITNELKRLVSASAGEVPTKPKRKNRAIPALRSPRKPRRTAASDSGRATTAIKDPVVSPIGNDHARKTRRVLSDDAEVDVKQQQKPRGQYASPAKDLQRYYRTELLTAEEEYTLGAQIQFMIACEDVHEGLAVRLARLPTLGEWAAACGFTAPDPKFKASEADQHLRPAGSEVMFEDVDPRMFVGNGQIGEAGPGRGRGRAKKVPRSRLKDRTAESLVPPAAKATLTDRLTPVNRGTTRDFLDVIQSGREAKQRMVQSNMRLVVSIARKYLNVGVSLHDLVQEGSLGLSRAAEKFDPRKGFKFSTYASWWIQQAVFRSIAYQSRTIRLPVHIHNMLNRIHRVRNHLTKDHGRAPTNEEMASHLGMSLQKYNKLLRLTKRSISLDIPKYKSNPKDLGHEGVDMLGDTIDASSVSTVLLDDSAPEKLVDHTLFLDDLKDMLKILEKDERLVLCARYGLSDGITRTVTSVAAQMKRSKAWVRSQECRALRKLRRPWYEKKLKEHESSLSN